MSRLIGAMEISQYAQRYNMPFEENTPLTMAWCFDMVDAAERKGRTDAIDKCISKIDKLTTYYAGDKEGNALTPKVVIKEDVIKVLEQLKEQE